MRDALEEPVFAPYLGRKACPPALPFSPVIVRADTLRAAFESSEHSDDPFTKDLLDEVDTVRFYWEEDGTSGFEPDQVQRRRDQIVSRARWTFEERREHYTALSRDEDAA